MFMLTTRRSHKPEGRRRRMGGARSYDEKDEDVFGYCVVSGEAGEEGRRGEARGATRNKEQIG